MLFGERMSVMGFFKEFKAFAVKGNVIDMAVGVVIGGAFGKIVTSFVNDLIMPALSVLTGKVNLSALAVTVAGSGEEAISINYGLFLQNIVDFLIISLCVFIAIKMINKLKRKEEAAPPPPPVPTKEELLLTEIRDLLKAQQMDEIQ